MARATISLPGPGFAGNQDGRASAAHQSDHFHHAQQRRAGSDEHSSPGLVRNIRHVLLSTDSRFGYLGVGLLRYLNGVVPNAFLNIAMNALVD
jgi:hypothetical protein